MTHKQIAAAGPLRLSENRKGRLLLHESVSEHQVELSELPGWTGPDTEDRARLLIAALDAADCRLSDLAPSNRPHQHLDGTEEWEEWAGRAKAVPLAMATSSNAALAAFLRAWFGWDHSAIARRLDVSERSVDTYVSDFRNGRR